MLVDISPRYIMSVLTDAGNFGKISPIFQEIFVLGYGILYDKDDNIVLQL